MEHIKELELELLKRLKDTGRIRTDKFKGLFDDWDEDYQVVFSQILVDNYADKVHDILPDRTFTEYDFCITSSGKLRIKQLQKEKIDEEAVLLNRLKLSKESSTVSAWTIFLGIVGFLTLLATLYIIYLAYHPPVVVK